MQLMSFVFFPNLHTFSAPCKARLRSNAAAMGFKLVEDLSLIKKCTQNTNSMLLISWTPRLFFLRTAQLLHEMFSGCHKKVIISKLKHILYGKLNFLRDYLSENMVLNDIKVLINQKYLSLVDNENIFFADICNKKEFDVDFYGVQYKENRNYPFVIITDCVQDMGKCERFLAEYTNAMVGTQNENFIQQIFENRDVQSIFVFVIFFLVYASMYVTYFFK